MDDLDRPSGSPEARQKLTANKRRQIIEMISRGHSYRTAGAAVGVTATTICKEIKRFPAFRQRVEQARLGVIDTCLQGILACKPRWQALAWYLQVRYPEFRKANESNQQAGAAPRIPEKITFEIVEKTE